MKMEENVLPFPQKITIAAYLYRVKASAMITMFESRLGTLGFSNCSQQKHSTFYG
jgi:hypothetical protein